MVLLLRPNVKNWVSYFLLLSMPVLVAQLSGEFDEATAISGPELGVQDVSCF